MESRKRGLYIFLGALLACVGTILAGQQSPNATGLEDLPLGVWQSEQSDGTLVGVDLSTVPASVPGAVDPDGTPKQGSRLQIGVFQRRQERTACGDKTFFVTGWTGPGSEDGSAVYANQKLEIHYHDRRGGSEILRRNLEIDIELVLDPIKNAWIGRFHRDAFDRQVTLNRASNQPASVSPTLSLTYTSTPAVFQVELHNPRKEDLVLNLGFELANGREQYVTAVELTLTAPDGRVLHMEPPGPCIIAGRVDPLIVPLPAGATFSFSVDLDEFSVSGEKSAKLHFVPGRYTLQASYTGKAVTHGNVDCKGAVAMSYWIGTVIATPVVFSIPSDGQRNPDH